MVVTQDAAWQRAYRAICCSPFTPQLFHDIGTKGVPLRSLVGKEGVEKGYVLRSLPLLTAENALLWLIQVGVLRREVDGQGITDSFRLTPLGHRLLQSLSQEKNFPTPSVTDRLWNWILGWKLLGLLGWL